MKKSDLFVFGILIFIASTATITYLTAQFILGVVAGSVMTIAYVSALLLLKKKTHYEKKEDFIRNILLKGKTESDRLIRALYPEACVGEQALIKGEEMIINAVKYGGAGEEDVASAYRKAEEKHIGKVIVYCRKADKSALYLANSLPLSIEFRDLKKLFTELKGKGLLPYSEPIPKKRRKLKEIFAEIKKTPPKYFLFTAIVCATSSLLFPLKIYYLVIAAVNAALGLTIILLNYKEA